MPADDTLFQDLLNEIKDEVPIFVAPEMTLKRPGVFRTEKAFIAETLTPNVEPNLTPDSKIKIVGYDAGYLEKENEIWYASLERWLNHGCDITYLLIKPQISAGVQHKFEQLADTSHAGRFAVKVIPQDTPKKAPDEALLKKWETFHFCLFEKPSQLWVETNHPIGEHEALDCYYVPPDVVKDMADYRILDSQFDHIDATYGVQVIPALQ